MDRLKLALAIGREQRADHPKTVRALKEHPKRACSTAPVLAVGVMTAPSNVGRRRRMRAARDVMLARGGDLCAVALTFVVGAPELLTHGERQIVLAENRRYGDLVMLPAHDGISGSDVTHGGRAVAEKALAWFVHAANKTNADFVAKIDDDTLVNLPRLVGELRGLASHTPRPGYAYYGVLVYRLWNWVNQPRVGDAACGPHSESGPPHSCDKLLGQLRASVQPGATCAGSIGPYPFPDGSLEVVGRQALRAVFGSERVRAFAALAFAKRHPPFWSHEDAGLGALAHREVVERKLPMTYVALRRWEHNRFWLNWADTSTLIDGDVQWAHYTRSAERSDYVGGAFAMTATLAADGLSCGECGKQWGWEAPVESAMCCSKPKATKRAAHPRQLLRKRFVPESALNLTCGLGSSAKPSRYQLGILTRTNEADERYALRRLLSRDAAKGAKGTLQVDRAGHVSVCFVLDTTPPRGGWRQPGALFNTRAWLYYEAGRRADFDLSTLSREGNFAARRNGRSRSSTDEASVRWWARAASHAKGPEPAEYYALVTVSALLESSGPAERRLVPPGPGRPWSWQSQGSVSLGL